MSSERAGTPTVGICGIQMRNTPRRNIICDLPAGHMGWHSAPDYEAIQPGVLQALPRIHWAERVGVHTSGALNREAVVAAVQSYLAAPSWSHSPYLGVQASEIVALVLDGPSA